MKVKANYLVLGVGMLLTGLVLVWLADYKSHRALGTLGIFLSFYGGVIISKARQGK